MTPNCLTHHAERRLQSIRHEMDRLTNAIGFSGMLGASDEHLKRLNEKRRYYQLILKQAEKER